MMLQKLLSHAISKKTNLNTDFILLIKSTQIIKGLNVICKIYSP